jgi:hypothetical protein
MSSSRHPSIPRPSDPEIWTVESELPDPIPILKAELDTIELYFGDMLNAVFEPKTRAAPAASTVHQQGDKR